MAVTELIHAPIDIYTRVLTMDSDEEIKQRLLVLRKQTTERLHALEADVHHKKEPVEKDFAEQATQRENDDVLQSLDEEAKQTLIRIDNALQRLQIGEYGVCIHCGVDIPQPRLQVMPYAELCIACAENDSSW